MNLLVLDGNSILNRAFYGIKLLTTKNGEYTNAVYGFLTMMSKILSDTTPDAVAIAFDLKEPTFRHKKYDGYKANRHGMPEELASQLPIIKELLTSLGYKLVECPGFEADDILGTLASECESSGNSCILATGDRDSLQLVSKNVSVRLITTKNVVTYDEDKIMDEYGVTPLQLIDIKAIQGDTSDNIPGIKGIGQKGATDLITRYKNLDYIYENLDTIEVKPAMRKKLEEGRESAFLSRFLGEISKEAPIDKNLESYIPNSANTAKALQIMTRLELFSLIEKFGLNDGTAPHPQQEETKFEKCIFGGKVTAEEATTIIDSKNDTIFLTEGNCIAFYVDNKIYISDDIESITVILAKSDCKKVTHSVKKFFASLDKFNVIPKGKITDTELMAYLLNPSASSYDIDRLVQEYNADDITVNFCDNNLSENEVNLVKLTAHLVTVNKTLEKLIIENKQDSLLNEVEIPLAQVLASMENEGFMADKNGIEEFGNTLGTRIADIQKRIYNLVGYEFNINSPKQLGTALFEKLGLPPLKKTKSGYSTSAEVLEKLANDHPVVELVMEYRQLAKLKSTYCDGLLKVIDNTGRIHSSFNQTETRTGRISSTEPNLQNIPVRTELGREMRRFFVAKEGYVLVDADYSQIELRVLAHIANDIEMCNAFKNNDDIHAITASQVFGMPLEMVTPLMRSRAKAVNFGIVYGIGAFSLSKDIGVTVKEADRYIKAYLAHYDGVQQYMENIIEDAKNKGYVETMFNRRRYLPELSSSNKNMRAFGERVARNMPIQGTAADIIKIAMIKVYSRLKAEKLKAKLILQVHDELIVEAPIEEQEIVKKILQQEMENAVQLNVPLVAEAESGKTWYDTKS
ncbi:MAG: DNA polymerase I [Acutalibacteraceae bacterium]|nr:DNA polymerase I [Acutalibacteraceae bacterium]